VVEAGQTIRIRDVLVGEVWLASGQSNMAWAVKSSRDFAREREAADHPRIRMFTVKRRAATEPASRCEGSWQRCAPDTVGAFSATAYFFGRKLHQELDVAVGLINSSWGGTAVEAWTSMEVQKHDPRLQAMLAPWRERVAAWDPEKASRDHERRLEQWKKRAAAAKATGKRAPRRPRKASDPARDRNRPANLYRGMIAPLIPYRIRGAIWYQGERNARSPASARLYRHQLPLLIADWRARWRQGDFPFFWVQLPNFKKRSDDPGAVSAWAFIRESMAKCLTVPNTGMAITIDIGEAGNIHPKNKQDVGFRLALAALAKVYDRSNAASGPLLALHKTKGSRVVLSFRHTDGGLVAKGGKLRGFAIAGSNRKWRWARAEIDGDRVVVWHPEVARPAAVRYAWADNPDCNLYNGAGLPASPFRTDDWE
jgi:hypothetical protein